MNLSIFLFLFCFSKYYYTCLFTRKLINVAFLNLIVRICCICIKVFHKEFFNKNLDKLAFTNFNNIACLLQL